jgi:hypothetical protein
VIRFRPGAGAAVIAAAALGVTYLVAAPATAAEPPSVTVTPSCGEATTLTFEGRGASPGSSAYVDIDGLQVAYRIPVGADGRWTTTVDLEEPLDVGRHQVATSFAPETLDAPTTTFDLPCAPEIDVRPSRVARRSHAVDVALSGTSFVPFRLVELSVAGVAVSSGRPDRDGSISASLPSLPACRAGRSR